MSGPELNAANEAIRQLYQFAIYELDPEPCPVESYISDPDAQSAAHRALGRTITEARLAALSEHINPTHQDGQR